jgi:hypothetical protein
MKKLLLTSLAALALANSGIVFATDLNNMEMTASFKKEKNKSRDKYAEKIKEKEKSPSAPIKEKETCFAFFFAETPQADIGPEEIVKLTSVGVHTNKFELSANGGIVIPVKGSYLVNYRILSDEPSSIGLFINGALISETAYAYASGAVPVSAAAIIQANADDEVTIRNLMSEKKSTQLFLKAQQ